MSQFRKLSSAFVAIVLLTLPATTLAKPKSPVVRVDGASATHDASCSHTGESTPGWRRSPSGILVPGKRPPTLVEQVQDELRKRPDPILTPGEAAKKDGGLYLPKPKETPKLDVIHGSGSRGQIAETLESHGDFEAARHFAPEGKGPIGRSVPDSMRQKAVVLQVPGVNRRVYKHEPPPEATSFEEKLDRVLDTFFISGNVPGKNKLLRKEGQGPVASHSANQVYENSGDVYSFYKAVLGRFSIDDKGMPLQSVVHQQSLSHDGDMEGMENAYYRHDDKFMRYGDSKDYQFTSLSIT